MNNAKYVKVMADHMSSGVWDCDGIMLDADGLELSDLVLAVLAEWCIWYETSLDADWSMTQWEMFAAEGRKIAETIKRELPDWQVFYFDEAINVKNWEKGATTNQDPLYEIR